MALEHLPGRDGRHTARQLYNGPVAEARQRARAPSLDERAAPPPLGGDRASLGGTRPPAVPGDAPEVPSIASAMRLCRQRSAGLAVVWVPPVLVVVALAISTLQLGRGAAGGTAFGIFELIVVLLLFTAVPIAACFTLGVANYAGTDSGMAGWRRGLRSAPTALLLIIVVWIGASLVMLIPLVGWAASLMAIPVMLLAYPMLAFEDVGLSRVWRRLSQLLRLARDQRGAIGTMIALFAIMGGIVFVAFVLLMTAGVLALGIMDADPEEHTGLRNLIGAFVVAGLLTSLLVIPWTTIALAWATQVYERIRGMDVSGQSDARPGDRRAAIGV